MCQMNKMLLIVLLGLFTTGNIHARSASVPEDEKTVTFRFRSAEDMLTLKGNEAELTRLYALVDTYREQIAAGEMPVYVDGYCASLPTMKENLTTAFIRANRVKSELITQKRLKEADFRTANYASAYNGDRDVVIVTLRIPASAKPQPEAEAPTVVTVPTYVEPATPAAEQQEPEPATVAETAPQPTPATVPAKPYCFAVRTNVLYDAFLLPTLGVEWRINRDWGVKLDGSLSWWGGNSDKVQKIWLLNPEVRRYLLRDRRFYVGASGSYGEYNIYKYPLGNLFSKDTGYQGTLWSAGVTVGYQLCLSRHFSVDFNLGLGYARSKYDNFGMTDGVRVSKERGKTKNFFGPTQAGISLVWILGNNK